MCANDQGEQIPEFVDVRRLAKAKQNISGKIGLKKFGRLGQNLARCDGAIAVELQFDKDIVGLYYISGKLQGELQLTCQRCMQPMPSIVEHEFMLSPVWTDAQAKILPEYYEPVMLLDDERLSLAEIIEDELILQLPVLAKHDEQDCCVKVATLDENSEVLPKKPNPFAVLAALKKK